MSVSIYTKLFDCIRLIFLAGAFMVFFQMPLLGQNSTLTPNGIFDNVCDRFGDVYSLADLNIATGRMSGSGGSTQSYTICNAGHFKLYFEQGSFFALFPAAQQVLCQVYSDLSAFITSSVAPQSINIFCGSTAGTAAAIASAFYVHPNNPSSAYPGITDGQIYKALVSGSDPYLNIPLSFNNASAFYHGFVRVDPLYGNVFNYNLSSTAISGNQVDFYTLMLHEAMHTLGFASLIGATGQSRFALTSGNYYSRFDGFLHDHTGAALLSTTLTGCAPAHMMYTAPSASMVAPGLCTSTNHAFATTCSTAAQYIGTASVSVYTPHCFEAGSSLSHFEDMCSFGSFTSACTPTPSTPGYNDLLFVVSDANNLGSCYVKRHLQPEERHVLCDLGYDVQATFGGTTVAGSFKNYGGTSCAPATIYGHNDGLVQGTYIFTTTGTSMTIPHNTVLANDMPSGSLSITCLESVYNTATVIPGATDFTVNSSVGSGLQVVKYVPAGSSGVGNATYVFVYFVPPGCVIPNNCEIVENGGFECTTGGGGCGQIGQQGVVASHWDVYTNPNVLDGDIVSASCTLVTVSGYQINNMFSTSINTLNLGNVVNDKCAGLKLGIGYTTLRNKLKTSLISGHSYQLSFAIINHSALPSEVLNPANNAVVVTVATHTAATTPSSLHFPAGFNVISDFTINPGLSWNVITHTFVYTPTTSANYLLIGINHALTPTITLGHIYYCFLDQVSLQMLPLPAFSISNATVCYSDNIIDLAQYASGSGQFAGAGVSHNTVTGQYDFNLDGALPPGTYPIAFTFSTANCMQTIYENVVVDNCCTNTVVPELGVTTVTSSMVFTGKKRIANSFTVQGSNNAFLYGEFLIAPQVSITVENGAQLFVLGAHLYGCGDMWQGIRVMDGGKVVIQDHNGLGSMIEDAEAAVSVSAHSSSAVILDISNTVFNRNYVDIQIGACPNANGSSFNIHSNVFTCRQFSFNTTTWPQAALTDLRAASGGTQVLHGPYHLRDRPVATLKPPRKGEYPLAAISISSVGATSGSYPTYTYSAARIGQYTFANPETYFNLFDCHRSFVIADNSNLKLVNNVFQNSITFYPSFPKLPVVSFSATAADKSLDMSSNSVALGNRFFDFHMGVHVKNASHLHVEGAVFRSSQGVGTSTVGNGWGKDAITAVSSAISDYLIKDNEFNNIHLSIGLGTASGTVSSIAIRSNTFSPTLGISSTGTLVNYLNSPISLVCPILSVHSPSGSAGVKIEDNIIYRAYNGISLNGFSMQGPAGTCGAPLVISGNSILLEEVSHTQFHRGISIVNNLPLYSGIGCPTPTVNAAGFRSIADNTVSMFNPNLNSPKSSLFYAFNSAGVSVPPLYVTCNEVLDGYEGFVFEGWNPGVYWRGNKMTDLARGMTLKNGGVIGQQGSQTGTASDNEWLGGNWNSSNYGIYTFSSQAINSPIIHRTSPSQFDPPNLSGAPAMDSYLLTSGSLLSYTGSSSFSCGATYTQMPSIILPSEDHYTSESLLYLARSTLFKSLYVNEELKNENEEYHDFYEELQETAMLPFAELDKFLFEDDLLSAGALLSGLDPQSLNQIETYCYSFADLYLRYREAGHLDESELNQLAGLCDLCPATDGPCVYQARALYQLGTGEPFQGEDCGGGEGSRIIRRQPESLQQSNSPLTVSLFPNPAQRSVVINLNREANGLSVRVGDISGRVLTEKVFTETSSSFFFTFDLAPGVYLFTVSVGYENAIKKVIVAK